jgi:hypothetical protein
MTPPSKEEMLDICHSYTTPIYYVASCSLLYYYHWAKEKGLFFFISGRELASFICQYYSPCCFIVLVYSIDLLRPGLRHGKSYIDDCTSGMREKDSAEIANKFRAELFSS